MAPKSKGKARAAPQAIEAVKLRTAILLADSFTQRFRPITVDRPKCLLPLVNTPILEYVLDCLHAEGINRVILCLSAHAEMVQSYLTTSKWLTSPVFASFQMVPIVMQQCRSFGDALREIDQRQRSGELLIDDDFLFVCGDSVLRLDLDRLWSAHANRRKSDKDALVTACFRPTTASKTWLHYGDGPCAVTYDPETFELLDYEEGLAGGGLESKVGFHPGLMPHGAGGSVCVREDLLSCRLYMCAPEVLQKFTDNIDYSNLRYDLIAKGILGERDFPTKAHLHLLLPGEYATRIHNMRSYAAVTQDIIEGRASPYHPTLNLLPVCATKFQLNPDTPYEAPTAPGTFLRHRGLVFCEQRRDLAHSSIGRNVVIGADCLIEPSAKLHNVVLGRACRVGANVVLRDSCLWNEVMISNDCRVEGSLLADGAVLAPGSHLKPGTVISHGVQVYIPPEMGATPSMRLSLHEPPLTAAPDPEEDDTEVPQSMTRLSRFIHSQHGAQLYWWPTPLERTRHCFGGLTSEVVKGDVLAEMEVQNGGGSIEEEGEKVTGSITDSMLREVLETYCMCLANKADNDSLRLQVSDIKVSYHDRSKADLIYSLLVALLVLALPHYHNFSTDILHLFPKDEGDARRPALAQLAMQRQVGLYHNTLQVIQLSDDDQVELLEKLCSFAAGKENGLEWQGQMWEGMLELMLRLLVHYKFIKTRIIRDWMHAVFDGEYDDEHPKFRDYATRAKPLVEEVYGDDEDGDESEYTDESESESNDDEEDEEEDEDEDEL